MREIASEPAWQHFLKQNSFQPVPELALSDILVGYVERPHVGTNV